MSPLRALMVTGAIILVIVICWAVAWSRRVTLPGTREYDRYFFSRYVPRPILAFTFVFVKFAWWGPWPFVSLALGWFGLFGLFVPGPNTPAAQVYMGLKADPTETSKHGSPIRGEVKIVMVCTPSECLTARVRLKDGVDVRTDWTNMAG